jgi:DNA-binding NarL/FixJ family response regulator
VSSEPDEVTVYLLDRAGDAANAFAAKLQGREGVFLVGGAGDVEEALDDIGVASPEVILVGTDLGGSGVVAAVERVLAIAPDAAVVALSTSADKALVAQAVRSGAAGSLDRAASPGETITALHVYARRQRGEAVDMSLAEPPAETTTLRVSGALPRFPAEAPEEVPYQPRQHPPSGGDAEGLSAKPSSPGPDAPVAGVPEPPSAAPPASPPPPPPPERPPPPSEPPPSYASQSPPHTTAGSPALPVSEGATGAAEQPPAGPAEDEDDGVAQLRQMLRQEADAAGGRVAPAKEKRGFLGLFKGKQEPGPDQGGKAEGKQKQKGKKETKSR